MMPNNKERAYRYKRYMRDGSVQEFSAVTRSRTKKDENGRRKRT